MNFHLMLICLLICTVCAPQCRADDIFDMLDQAKKLHQSALNEAHKRIADVYHERIAAAVEKGDTTGSAEISEQLRFFEERHGIVLEDEMEEQFRAYGKVIKSAGDALKEAYAAAMKMALANGDSTTFDQLKAELDDLRLPVDLVSFSQSSNRLFIMHGGYLGYVRPATDLKTKMNSTWELVGGLANANFVSIRSPNVENYYLVHGNLRIRIQPYSDTEAFRQNSTFHKRKGLYGRGTGISFESINFPNHFIRRRGNGELWLDRNDGSDIFNKEATFNEANPRFRLW